MTSLLVISSILFILLMLFMLVIICVFVASLFVKRKFTKHTPKVSIIIPAYNEQRNIGMCLKSVRQNKYPEIEIIVVDDGSTDETLNIATKYDVKIIKQNHLGKVAALNNGLKASSHDIIIALDADTMPEDNSIFELVQPFCNADVGATTGVFFVGNNKSILGMFQNIEYLYNNLIRVSFSKLFNNGIWFFGAMAAYRKDVLEKVGHFKKDSLTEDMDIMLEIKRQGYRAYCAEKAYARTIVPETIVDYYKQRSRWWLGAFQALWKNKRLFTLKSSPSILFLFANQYWWSIYSLLSIPVIAYQVQYWLPSNTLEIGLYLFRWFSATGPLYYLYKLPEWGISVGIFGVGAGLISMALIIASHIQFREQIGPRNMIAILFYFPYTIILNMVIFISILKLKVSNKKYYLK